MRGGGCGGGEGKGDTEISSETYINKYTTTMAVSIKTKKLKMRNTNFRITNFW